MYGAHCVSNLKKNLRYERKNRDPEFMSGLKMEEMVAWVNYMYFLTHENTVYISSFASQPTKKKESGLNNSPCVRCLL
jgi:hypothetical protein